MLEYKNFSDMPVISKYEEGHVMTDDELKDLALQFRRDIIELTRFSGTNSSHLGGQLSAAEIMAVLYGRMLNLKPEDPFWEDRDIFIMGKGHCSAILYIAMAWRGFFGREKLWNEFNRYGGFLQEHCNMDLPGVEAPTGSLGMGLSDACGYAWSAKLNKKDKMVYIMSGDGECTEGQTWEGAGLAAQLKLDNLVCIVDYNKYIVSAKIEDVMDLEPFEKRWEAFRWHVQRIDGNDLVAVRKALDIAADPKTAPGQPRVIIADTKKDKGISFLEKDAVNWHAGSVAGIYDDCMKELGL